MKALDYLITDHAPGGFFFFLFLPPIDLGFCFHRIASLDLLAANLTGSFFFSPARKRHTTIVFVSWFGMAET